MVSQSGEWSVTRSTGHVHFLLKFREKCTRRPIRLVVGLFLTPESVRTGGPALIGNMYLVHRHDQGTTETTTLSNDNLNVRNIMASQVQRRPPPGDYTGPDGKVYRINSLRVFPLRRRPHLLRPIPLLPSLHLLCVST